MKSISIIIITAFFSVAGIHATYADGFHKQNGVNYINITITNALLDPGLVASMNAQIDPEFLQTPQLLYVAEVNYNGAVYRIIGSPSQWLSFFNRQWKISSQKTGALHPE